MENFSGIGPEITGDDTDSATEKKAKKEVKKVPLFELFEKPVEKVEKAKIDVETKSPEIINEAELPETSDEKAETAATAELDSSEKVVVSEQLIDDRLENVEAELDIAPLGSEQEAEAVAAATFLEKVGEKVENGESIDDKMLADASLEAANELGLPQESLDETQEEAELPDAEAAETEDPSNQEEETEVEEEDPAVPVPPASVTPPPVLPLPPVSPNNPSVNGPVPPYGGQPPLTPYSGGSAMGSTTPNTAPASPNILVAPEADNSHSHLKYVLAGGLLGYLIGRRRGRIKTEKRLLPVQNKLEKQVASLQEKLYLKEQAIRRSASLNRESLHHVERREVQEKVRQERAKRAETFKVYEKSTASRPEKFGKFALSPNVGQEKIRPNENVNDKQLLEIAGNIKVGNQTLDVLYSTGKIELKDLKEIVNLYLQGKSYEQLLTKSLKPERFETFPQSQTANPLQPTELAGPVQLAQLLPNIAGLRQKEDLRFGHEKETHVVAKIGMVAGIVTLVVVMAVVIVLVLLGAL